MIQMVIDVTGLEARELKRQIKRHLDGEDPNAVVRVKFTGEKTTRAYNWISAAELRYLAPETMNISLAYPRILRQS
jgi:hypothetical protein